MIRNHPLLSTVRAACAAALLSVLPAAAQGQGPAAPAPQGKATAEDARNKSVAWSA